MLGFSISFIIGKPYLLPVCKHDTINKILSKYSDSYCLHFAKFTWLDSVLVWHPYYSDLCDYWHPEYIVALYIRERCSELSGWLCFVPCASAHRTWQTLDSCTKRGFLCCCFPSPVCINPQLLRLFPTSLPLTILALDSSAQNRGCSEWSLGGDSCS